MEAVWKLFYRKMEGRLKLMNFDDLAVSLWGQPLTLDIFLTRQSTAWRYDAVITAEEDE